MRREPGRALTVVAASAAALLLTPWVIPAAAESENESSFGPERPYRLVWDDYSNGLDTEGPDADWWLLADGDYVADDGIVTTSRGQVEIAASGTHPETGEPAFTNTLAQEEENGGIRGDLDHVKWLSYANHEASTGQMGFDAVPGRELSCETTMWGHTTGTEEHPFGDAVVDPQDDLRLASVGLTVHDVETDTLFEFLFTNTQIYVFYERLAANRTEDNNYWSFLYTIPVADREPEDSHRFRISYDRENGKVFWYLDGRRVFEVDRIGESLDPTDDIDYGDYLMLDHGGVEEEVEPRQLACGMGSFTIVDGAVAQPGHDGDGLVKLSTAEDHYFDPVLGEPYQQNFLDEESLEGNRVWGQGATFGMTPLVISSTPIRR
ncbi:DUF6081 family protein [Nocardiopsis nanhaiensis]